MAREVENVEDVEEETCMSQHNRFYTTKIDEFVCLYISPKPLPLEL